MKPKLEYKAVIFNCDGVLVDSERLGVKVFSEVLCSLGFNFTPSQCFQSFKGLD